MLLKADPTFYPSPKLAAQTPPEKLAYVAALHANGGTKPGALTVVNVDPQSDAYRSVVGQVEMPNVGDELHHFGWNACSSGVEIVTLCLPSSRQPGSYGRGLRQ